MSKNLIFPLPKKEAEELAVEHDIEILGEVFRPRQRRWLTVEIDEAKIADMLGNLREDIDNLVDEVGYPGPQTELARILENIHSRLSALEDKLGVTD